MRQAVISELKLLKKRQAKFFLPVAAIFLFLTVQIKSQPGGCYSDTWRYEYCREQRTALIKNYDSEIKKIDAKIAREPRNVEYYYQRGKIYTAMMFTTRLGFKDVEFDGQKYFTDIDAKAITDFTQAVRLSPKSSYFNERGKIFLAYWEQETNSFQYFNYRLGNEKKTDAEILQILDELFFINVNFKSAESDFRQAIELNTDSESAQSAAERLASLRRTRGFWLSHYEYVAKLIGNTARAGLALADFDYSIEQAKISTAKYDWSNNYSIHGGLLEKAIAAKRFGKEDAALKAVDEAINLEKKDGFPNCAIYSTRAEIYFNQKKFEPAIKDLTYAIENSPNCKSLIEQRGDVYLGKGETAKAIENYSLILNDKNFPYTKDKIYWKRGKVYLQTGEGEKAAADFTTAIGYGTLCEKDYEFRARAFRLAGNEQAAKADDEKVLETLKNQKNYLPSDYCYYHLQ